MERKLVETDVELVLSTPREWKHTKLAVRRFLMTMLYHADDYRCTGRIWIWEKDRGFCISVLMGELFYTCSDGPFAVAGRGYDGEFFTAQYFDSIGIDLRDDVAGFLSYKQARKLIMKLIAYGLECLHPPKMVVEDAYTRADFSVLAGLEPHIPRPPTFMDAAFMLRRFALRAEGILRTLDGLSPNLDVQTGDPDPREEQWHATRRLADGFGTPRERIRELLKALPCHDLDANLFARMLPPSPEARLQGVRFVPVMELLEELEELLTAWERVRCIDYISWDIISEMADVTYRLLEIEWREHMLPVYFTPRQSRGAMIYLALLKVVNTTAVAEVASLKWKLTSESILAETGGYE